MDDQLGSVPLLPYKPSGVTKQVNIPVVSKALVNSVVANNASQFKHVSVAYNEGLSHMERRRTGEEMSIKTPWDKINNETLDGIPWHSVVVIGARPSHGKTAFVSQITREAFALNPTQDFAVLDFQLEMMGKSMAIREFSMHFHRSVKFFNNAEKGDALTPADIAKARAYAEAQSKLPIYYEDGVISVKSFKQKVIDFHKALKKPFIVTLDHTVLIQKGATDKNVQEMLYELGTVLTELKRKLPVIFFVITQLNRECERTERLEPGSGNNYLRPSDIFGADAFQMHADMVLGLLIPARLNIPVFGSERIIVSPDLMVVHLLKNREGDAGTSTFFQTKFEEMRVIEWPGGDPPSEVMSATKTRKYATPATVKPALKEPGSATSGPFPRLA